LQFWLTGRPQHASARRRLDADGLLQQLQEQGWQIEYRDWFRDLAPPLPKRIVARNGKFQLRLAISRWQTGPAVPGRD
jgi:outer membrane lipoprotein LolB